MRLTLMFAGVLPFVAGAVIAGFGLSLPAPLSAWPEWYRAYTLVIGSFMAGTLWQSPVVSGDAPQTGLLIISNIAALGLWVATGLLGPSAFLICAALVFAGLLICDYQRGLEPGYLQARMAVSVIVCSCLIIVAVSL